MSRANDSNIVKMQYSSDKNFKSRVDLHKYFSTNKYGWANWVFDQYKFEPNSHVIEIGCGNGVIWQANEGRIPEGIQIELTDLSEGMLTAARKNTEGIEQITKYSVMDIQNIPYEDNSFDIIIANHMLYHVPNRDLAIKEISRVLKPEGAFYAATNGANHMKGLKNLVSEFDSRIDYAAFSVAKEFGLENGREQLSKYFASVDMQLYEDSLHVTDPQPLMGYILSLEGHTNIRDIITEDRLQEFYDYLARIILQKGSIDIPKSSGMFIAKNPIKREEDYE